MVVAGAYRDIGVTSCEVTLIVLLTCVLYDAIAGWFREFISSCARHAVIIYNPIIQGSYRLN